MNISRHRRAIRTFSSSILATSLLLSGCGGDSDPSAVSASPPATTPPPAATPAPPAATPPSAAAPASVGSGLPCSTLGETATTAGTRYDCVVVGTGGQWQPRGSRLNPLGRGEAVNVVTDYATWRIAVTGFTPDIGALIAAASPTNPPPPSGSQYTGLQVALTFLGGTGVNVVRNGVYLFGITGSTNRLERWAAGTGTQDDCWINEAVEVNATKACTMPYLVPSSEVGTIDFYAADLLNNPIVYFRGAPR